VGKLQNVYIAAPTKDACHQECLFFYDECVKQGVQVEFREWKGWPHFFWAVPVLRESRVFMEVWCEKLKEMLGSSQMV
jgi:hypothetical protein